MKTVATLKQERLECITAAESLLDLADEENRALTKDEDSKYKTLLAEVEILSKEIERREPLEAQKKAMLAKQAKDDEADNGDHQDRTAGGFRPIVRSGPTGPTIELPRSYGRLRAFPRNDKGQMAAYRSGMWIRAVIFNDRQAAQWCHEHGVGVRAALSGGVNTAGGALVPIEFENAIIDLREEYGVFRRLARVRPMGTDSLVVPRRTGGLTAYYVGENTAGTESDASWDDVQLTAKKLMAITRMSSELAEDATIDLADYLADELAYAFAVKEDTVGFTGTGAQTDGGIVGVNVVALDGSHNLAKVTATSDVDTLPEITIDDVINLMAAIPSYAKRGATFVCSPTAKAVVFDALKAAGGGNTITDLEGMPREMFLGYPIAVTDVYPDSASTDYSSAVMIGFGNLNQAVSMGERRGIRVAISTEAYFAQDQIAIKGTVRHDINVHDLGSNTVKSPFCVLVGN